MPKFGKSAFARFLAGTVAAILAVAPSISTVSASSAPLESIPLNYGFQTSMGQYVSQRGSEGLISVDDQYSYWIHTEGGVRGIYRKTLVNSGSFELVTNLSAYASETLSPVRSEAEDSNFYFVGKSPDSPTYTFTYTFRSVNKADWTVSDLFSSGETGNRNLLLRPMVKDGYAFYASRVESWFNSWSYLVSRNLSSPSVETRLAIAGWTPIGFSWGYVYYVWQESGIYGNYAVYRRTMSQADTEAGEQLSANNAYANGPYVGVGTTDGSTIIYAKRTGDSSRPYCYARQSVSGGQGSEECVAYQWIGNLAMNRNGTAYYGASSTTENVWQGLYSVPMTGTVPTNFTFADGQHELNLWIPQELSSAVIEFDASVPAGTSFSVSAANTTTESYVFTETDMMNGLGAEGVLGAETMGNTVYFGHWGDGSTSFELGASLAAVYSQISTPGTVLVQNGNEYVVQSAQNQWNFAYVTVSGGSFSMSEPISVRSKNWTPLGLPTASSAPTSQDFSGTSRATVNFGMPSQNIAVKITLSGNSNDRSKTPHLTNIAIYDPATYVSEEPNAGGNETGAANVGINRSAVADAVLDALGLTDLVSGGRSHAFNDEQKAKAEKYVQFLASPDFTAKVSAAGNSKVLWVDLSDWNP